MFKIGATYVFEALIDGKPQRFTGVIESYEHPLIKLTDWRLQTPPTITGTVREGPLVPGKILNTTSLTFISAQELIERATGDTP